MKEKKSIKSLNESNVCFLPEKRFVCLDDYQEWAKKIGYPLNILEPRGVEGINMDYFHTPSSSKGYTSGKIVIGDSRCCQLGIYQQRTGQADFSVFAVWGGHFLAGADPQIMNDELISAAEECFKEQIRSCGKCTVFLFSTVNDFDCMENKNGKNINAAVFAAEKFASMSFEYNGKTYRPRTVVIGFAGGHTTGDIYSVKHEDFNRFISDYNKELQKAVKDGAILKETSELFTTVPTITGDATDFITDGLHYGDKTLDVLNEYIKNHEIT